MNSGEFFAQLKQSLNGLSSQSEQLGKLAESGQDFILHTFGQNGLYASYILIAALILFVAIKLFSLALSTLKYLVVPSLALALAGALFLPYSFGAILPVTASACSVFLLAKG